MSRLKMLLLFLINLSILVLALRLLSWVPLAIEENSVRRWTSKEAVMEEMKLRKLFMPSYFPQYLRWPPSEILAGKTPSPSVLMHFSHNETKEIVLAISQRALEGRELKSRIEPSVIKKEEIVMLKGRQAKLLQGLCPDSRKPCSKLTWQEGQYILTVTSRDSIAETIKIAESMLQ
ncbi:MAG: hypothetical protein HY805_05795 [Nitrospirae bacterium]|nr:hypothetical protein [Nitrospirota bacterium]